MINKIKGARNVFCLQKRLFCSFQKVNQIQINITLINKDDSKDRT